LRHASAHERLPAGHRTSPSSSELELISGGSERRWPELIALALLFVVVIAAATNYIAWLQVSYQSMGRFDFGRYREFWHAFVNFGPGYHLPPIAAPDHVIDDPALPTYPPTFFLLFSPWALLGDELARATWLTLMQVSMAATLAIVYLGIGRPRLMEFLVTMGLALMFLPIRGNDVYGQVNPAVVALSAAALLGYRRRKPALGGLALAVAAALKLAPLLLLVYFAWRRAWTEVAWTLAWLGALLAATLAIGWGPKWYGYFPVSAMLNRGTAIADNGALSGMVLRLLRPDLSGLPPPPIPLAVAGIQLGASAIMVVGIAAVIWRLGTAEPVREWAGYGLALLLVLLLQPFAWPHHWAAILVLLPVTARLLAERRVRRAGVSLMAGAYAALTLQVILLPVERSFPTADIRSHPLLLVLSGLPLLAMMMLAIALWLGRSGDGYRAMTSPHSSSRVESSGADVRFRG
jgi:Glycosyltransferase family 87